ncbi:MAG: hypothetical protein ACO2ZN_07350 [Paracoccaceae bacterium]
MLLRRYGCVGERRWRIVLTDALHKCSIPPFWMVFSKTFSELVRGVSTALIGAIVISLLTIVPFIGGWVTLGIGLSGMGALIWPSLQKRLPVAA